jgi:hypothetical protein
VLGDGGAPTYRRPPYERLTFMTVVTTLDITDLTPTEYRSVLDELGVERPRASSARSPEHLREP